MSFSTATGLVGATPSKILATQFFKLAWTQRRRSVSQHCFSMAERIIANSLQPQKAQNVTSPHPIIVCFSMGSDTFLSAKTQHSASRFSWSICVRTQVTKPRTRLPLHGPGNSVKCLVSMG